MSTVTIVIMFWALELTIIVGGLMLARSFDNNYKMIIQTYKEMVRLINEKDDAREKVYNSMMEIHRLTNEQYERMMKVFENSSEVCKRLIDYGKTLNAHYYTLEDRYSQIYEQFDECHRQLNDIRKFVEPENLDVTLKLDTESLVQKKEEQPDES